MEEHLLAESLMQETRVENDGANRELGRRCASLHLQA
jgi:hypothetical protein